MKIQKIMQNIIYLAKAESFAAIGDPGCEGLGTVNMKIYETALRESGQDTFTLVAGDLVPAGTKHFYETVCSITEAVSANDVYVLRGNHDTGEYETYFGKKNYALIAPGFAVIVLDNAKRTFEAEGLELAASILRMPEVRNVVLAFHIPIPNHFIRNSVSEEEFARLRETYSPFRQKVKYFLCGHVHSRFIDTVDEIPLICTGGGGAMIEDVSKEIRACDIDHHIVHFFLDGNDLNFRIQNLTDSVPGPANDSLLREKLEETVKGEMMAHLRYLSFADRARKRGMHQIAALFEALADSEYRHARNFYTISEQPSPYAETPAAYLLTERFEYEKFYPVMAEYAAENHAPLTEQAYRNAAAAEKIHAKLLKEAENPEQYSARTLSVCPVCGYVMEGENVPDRCPICGAPAFTFTRFPS